MRSLGRNTASSFRARSFSAPELSLGEREAKLDLVVLHHTHPVASAAPGGWVERLKPDPFSIVGNITNDELFVAGQINGGDAELLVDYRDGVFDVLVLARVHCTSRKPGPAQRMVRSNGVGI